MLREVTVKGRGGTSFDEPVKYAHEHHYDGLIVMTDGMAEEPKIPENFKCKILWVCEEIWEELLSTQLINIFVHTN